MIISRTPYRISFFGGGTDYPAWYREHGGAVLACSIDKYAYLTCRYLPPFFENKHRVVWSRIENCTSLDEIAHPAVRSILKHLNIERGVEIHHQGDLPARSGMGSSSSFTVGLLHALYALQGQMPGKRKLAMESIHIEQEIMKESVGSQDQVSAVYGGLNHIEFAPNDEISVRPVTISRSRFAELESHLMLFYTGIMRTAAEVAKSYTNQIEKRKRQLRIMRDIVAEGISILATDGDIIAFGELLHESWEVKRSLSDKVSNTEVDDLYLQARGAGAIGGKLMGAGGGGFMLLFVPSSLQQGVRERLSRVLHVPFRIESSGSQIIFFDPEQDYSVEERDRDSRSIEAFRELVLETVSPLEHNGAFAPHQRAGIVSRAARRHE
jgi:D-glycero-alpha-D-manno-heptose-7-phosphate kinase